MGAPKFLNFKILNYKILNFNILKLSNVLWRGASVDVGFIAYFGGKM